MKDFGSNIVLTSATSNYVCLVSRSKGQEYRVIDFFRHSDKKRCLDQSKVSLLQVETISRNKLPANWIM